MNGNKKTSKLYRFELWFRRSLEAPIEACLVDATCLYCALFGLPDYQDWVSTSSIEGWICPEYAAAVDEHISKSDYSEWARGLQEEAHLVRMVPIDGTMKEFKKRLAQAEKKFKTRER